MARIAGNGRQLLSGIFTFWINACCCLRFSTVNSRCSATMPLLKKLADRHREASRAPLLPRGKVEVKFRVSIQAELAVRVKFGQHEARKRNLSRGQAYSGRTRRVQ